MPHQKSSFPLIYSSRGKNKGIEGRGRSQVFLVPIQSPTQVFGVGGTPKNPTPIVKGDTFVDRGKGAKRRRRSREAPFLQRRRRRRRRRRSQKLTCLHAKEEEREEEGKNCVPREREKRFVSTTCAVDSPIILTWRICYFFVCLSYFPFVF